MGAGSEYLKIIERTKENRSDRLKHKDPVPFTFGEMESFVQQHRRWAEEIQELRSENSKLRRKLYPWFRLTAIWNRPFVLLGLVSGVGFVLARFFWLWITWGQVA